jgi:hypothetical protein
LSRRQAARRQWANLWSHPHPVIREAAASARQADGYYLEFDVAMLNREIWPMLGVRPPQQKIEASAMYYDHKFRQMPAHARGETIDLRLATIMNDLALPLREAHDAHAVLSWGPGLCEKRRDDSFSAACCRR